MMNKYIFVVLSILSLEINESLAAVSYCYTSGFGGDYTGVNTTCSTTSGVTSPSYCYKLTYMNGQVVFKGCDDRSNFNIGTLCSASGGPVLANSTIAGSSYVYVYCCDSNNCNFASPSVKPVVKSIVAIVLASAAFLY